MSMIHEGPLPTSATCFICGEDNPCGLHGRFYLEGNRVVLPLCIDDNHCGYPGVVHGGIVAAALDECMGWAAACAIQRMCVTGELVVRYLKPTPPHVPLRVYAESTKKSRLLVKTTAWVEDEAGVRYAQAEGRFLPLTKEQTIEIDDGMCYKGDEVRVFEDIKTPSGA